MKRYVNSHVLVERNVEEDVVAGGEVVLFP